MSWAGCRPSFDPASEISYEFCQELVDDLVSENRLVGDLPGDDATRQNVELILKANVGCGLLFYNHGDKTGLVQQGGKGYVIDKGNDHLLKDREVYSLACLWGADGGIDAWKKGAKAVWCYVEVVSFTTDALDEFKTFFNFGFKLRLEGHDWKECLVKAKEKASELIDRLVGQGKIFAAMLLRRDRDVLRCYTPEDPPESDCWFRRQAIRLLGPKLGWRIGWSFILYRFSVWTDTCRSELFSKQVSESLPPNLLFRHRDLL